MMSEVCGLAYLLIQSGPALTSPRGGAGKPRSRPQDKRLTRPPSVWYGWDAMKLTVDQLLRSKIRNRAKIAQAIHAIDRLRRKSPACWRSVEILRKLRESR